MVSWREENCQNMKLIFWISTVHMADLGVRSAAHEIASFWESLVNIANNENFIKKKSMVL